jgi:hypothetical protein
VRYTALLDHYDMAGTRNNRGVSHENGSVESSHRYLKEAIEQALLLRGHRDFDDRPAYEGFVRDAVMRRNRRNAAAFRIEREQLRDLPTRRTTDFVEEEARVTRCGTFTVRAILYSAPSRLIGHRLKVRLYSDRLDCYLSGALVLTLSRGTRSALTGRGRVIDYRHFIDALKRKPQAFEGLVFRDALFPREAYRRTWEQLELGSPSARPARPCRAAWPPSTASKPCWPGGWRICCRPVNCPIWRSCAPSSHRARPRCPPSRWRCPRRTPMTRCCPASKKPNWQRWPHDRPVARRGTQCADAHRVAPAHHRQAVAGVR